MQMQHCIDGDYKCDHLFWVNNIELVGGTMNSRFTTGAKLEHPAFSTIAWHNFQNGNHLSWGLTGFLRKLQCISDWPITGRQEGGGEWGKKSGWYNRKRNLCKRHTIIGW